MKRTISVVAGLGAMILSNTVQADLPTQKVLTLDLALEAAQAAIADCKKKGFDTVVAVVLDRYGEEQVLLRSETAKVTRAQRVAIRKAYTALDSGTPSSTVMNAMAADPAVFARTAFINPNYTPQQGGLPIKVGNDVIGALAVAGTPGPAAADEGCAIAGLAKIRIDLNKYHSLKHSLRAYDFAVILCTRMNAMRRSNRPVVTIMVALLTAFAAMSADAATHHAANKGGGGGGKGGGGAGKAGGKNVRGGAVIAPQTGDANVRVEKQIAAVKAAPDAAARADAAGGLVDALVGVNMASITPQTISDLSALLSSDRENTVRYWAALALGSIGPRASAAAPALENALKDAEKLAADDAGSPAGAICLAFMRIDIKPADGRCVNGQYLDAKQKAAYDASQAAKAAAPPAQPAKNIPPAPAAAPATAPAP